MRDAVAVRPPREAGESGGTKADPQQDAGAVAQAIVRAQVSSGRVWLDAAQRDAGAAKVNEVPAASAPEDTGGAEDADADAKETVALWSDN